MPKIAKELTAIEVKRLAHPGGFERPAIHPVGGVSGLYLQVTPNGGRSWLLRAAVGKKRRELGLGSYPEISLSVARDLAREARAKIKQGVDPVAERKAQRVALEVEQRRGLTFADAVDQALAAKVDQFRNEKHRDQWGSTLRTYAVPILGKMLVDDIGTRDVLSVLQPIWASKTETANRLRGRIEAVLSWATVAGHRTGENPARWKDNLKELLPAPSKIAKVTNHPALQLDDAPRWFAALRKLDGMGSRALEFLTLTAARSGEVRGATWEEIDLATGVWTIPAVRMKMDREHRIPLTTEALALLNALPRLGPLVFPAPRGGEMSDMTLSATMKRMQAAAPAPGYVDRVSKRPAVPHGLRSTFRDWAAERTEYPSDMAETALAHKVGNAVEVAYRRGDMLEKRRDMMSAWQNFLTNP